MFKTALIEKFEEGYRIAKKNGKTSIFVRLEKEEFYTPIHNKKTFAHDLLDHEEEFSYNPFLNELIALGKLLNHDPESFYMPRLGEYTLYLEIMQLAKYSYLYQPIDFRFFDKSIDFSGQFIEPDKILERLREESFDDGSNGSEGDTEEYFKYFVENCYYALNYGYRKIDKINDKLGCWFFRSLIDSAESIYSGVIQEVDYWGDCKVFLDFENEEVSYLCRG